MLIDSHAHLDDAKYEQDREEVIDKARRQGVEYIINISCDLPSSFRTLELAEKYNFIYAAVGMHPDGLETENEEQAIDTIRQLAEHKKTVAIGEIGLDYHWDTFPREQQQHFFRRQLELADQLNLPVVIHNRDSHEDVFRILKEQGVGKAGGVMHCYSGSWEMAREYIDMGMFISFAGPVTFTNARKVAEVAKKVPLESMLIETDCPYLAPHPYRGKRNESALVSLVAEKIAELKEISYQQVIEQTGENALKLFNIKHRG